MPLAAEGRVMARLRIFRNTTTEHVCRTCGGAGEVIVNDTNPHGFGPDPQCDEPMACPEPRCFHGWVTWAPVDPLELVARARRIYLRGHRAPTLGQQYREARIRAFRPVRLPTVEKSRFECEARFDTAAAIANFRGFDALFRSVFEMREARRTAA